MQSTSQTCRGKVARLLKPLERLRERHLYALNRFQRSGGRQHGSTKQYSSHETFGSSPRKPGRVEETERRHLQSPGIGPDLRSRGRRSLGHRNLRQRRSLPGSVFPVDGPGHLADDVRRRVSVLQAGAGGGKGALRRRPGALPAADPVPGPDRSADRQHHRSGRGSRRHGRGAQPADPHSHRLDRRRDRGDDRRRADLGLLHLHQEHLPLAGAGAPGLCRVRDPRQTFAAGRHPRQPHPPLQPGPPFSLPARRRHRHHALGVPLLVAVQSGGGRGDRQRPHQAVADEREPRTKSWRKAGRTSSSACSSRTS